MTGTAFVFPGQGSQYPGMIRELGACDAEARELVGVAEQVTGLRLRSLMGTADAATMADPRIAQLLVFVSSSVLLHELRARGVEPAVVAGHSLGEYSALAAAGVLPWRTCLDLVAFRGSAMADAARRRPGTMGAVVGLPLTDVEGLCADVGRRHGGPIGVANVNSARQVVVSGAVDAVQAVLDRAAASGALRAKRIPVGGAYHSPLMEDARHRLGALLERTPMHQPRTPFVSSVTGELVTDVEAYRGHLVAQVSRPVRWHAVVQRLAAIGVTRFVEVGPGRVLSGLGRETVRGARHVVALDALREAARLATAEPVGAGGGGA